MNEAVLNAKVRMEIISSGKHLDNFEYFFYYFIIVFLWGFGSQVKLPLMHLILCNTEAGDLLECLEECTSLPYG